MQVIAGVHFNYSIAETFWPIWHQFEAEPQLSLREFRDQRYMGQIRNLQHFGALHGPDS